MKKRMISLLGHMRMCIIAHTVYHYKKDLITHNNLHIYMSSCFLGILNMDSNYLELYCFHLYYLHK